jgi:hypothetical protein
MFRHERKLGEKRPEIELPQEADKAQLLAELLAIDEERDRKRKAVFREAFAAYLEKYADKIYIFGENEDGKYDVTLEEVKDILDKKTVCPYIDTRYGAMNTYFWILSDHWNGGQINIRM